MCACVCVCVCVSYAALKSERAVREEEACLAQVRVQDLQRQLDDQRASSAEALRKLREQHEQGKRGLQVLACIMWPSHLSTEIRQYSKVMCTASMCAALYGCVHACVSPCVYMRVYVSHCSAL